MGLGNLIITIMFFFCGGGGGIARRGGGWGVAPKMISYRSTGSPLRNSFFLVFVFPLGSLSWLVTSNKFIFEIMF